MKHKYHLAYPAHHAGLYMQPAMRRPASGNQVFKAGFHPMANDLSRPLQAGMQLDPLAPIHSQSDTVPGPVVDAPEIINTTPVEDIAREAYRRYVEQGSMPGNEVRHWLEAEAEIRTRPESRGHNGGVLPRANAV